MCNKQTNKIGIFVLYLVHKGRDLLRAVETGDFEAVKNLLKTQVILSLN